MISRFSVRKPYTVIVGVVLVIILGIVAYTKMTVDLLPSIDMPYAIVMTSYPGASPEQVEKVVTRPVEQSMATVSNIKNVSSISAENYSVVILEFEETANMDSATIEMRELLDQIGSYWDDMIGNPIVMKINPDMLPVMVSAVGVEGASGAEATKVIEEEVLPELESVEGVASVTATGNITESIEITLSEEKIAKLNDDVKRKLDRTFADAQKKLDDAKAQVEEGKKQLETGTAQAAEAMGAAEVQLSSGEAQITQGLIEIKEKEAELNLAKLAVDTAASAAKIAIDELNAQKQQAQKLIDSRDAVQAELDQVTAQIKALEDAGEEVPQKLRDTKNELTLELQTIDIAKQRLPEIIAAIDEVIASLSQIEEKQKQVNEGIAALEAVKSQLTQGQLDLAAARGQMASGEISAAAQLASGAAQLAVGESQLTQGEEQLKSSKETAYDSADIDKIINKEMLSGMLAAQNFNMPAGYVTEEGIKYLVRVGDKFETVEDVSELALMDLTEMGAGVVKVSDIADVEKTDNEAEVYAKINGDTGILLTMQKQTGYSTGDVSDRILERCEKLKDKNPALNIATLMDQGLYIDYIVTSVFKNMIIGAILAILVLLLFLKTWRPTAIIACAIPLSVMTAVVCMYFTGVTINMISLSGLALGIGMLVDNAIVVIENIYRLRSQGIPAKEAAITGANQVAGAIAASTLTTVCVFLPIVFTEGITKQLFVDMGLTIGFSLVASLVVALTLVPMMGAGILKAPKETKGKFYYGILNVYEKLLRGGLKHKGLVLLGALILLLGSGAMELSRGASFMPTMESTQVSITLEAEEGTPEEEIEEMADTAMERIMKYDDVTDVGAMTGATDMMGMGADTTGTVTMYAVLKEDKELSNKELEDAISADLADLNCEAVVSADMMDMSALGGTGITVEVTGRDLDTLQNLAEDTAEILEGTKGLENVDAGLGETTPELRITVDKAKATQHNLTVAQVYQAVAARISEASAASTLSTDTDDYDIFIYDGKDDALTREDIKNMKITATDTEGKDKKVALKDIAYFSDTRTLSAINRKAQTRYINVTAEVAEGYNVTLLSSAVQKELDRMDVPDGYKLKMAGEDETIKDALQQLGLMLLLAILFMYLIMVAQFQSLKSPFIIMFTIPLAFTGGLLGLFISGFDFSVVAMLGFVVLAGVIVNNGIVFVDYTNQLVRDGIEINEALVEAGRTRMRPIIMTAITTVLGLLTLAFGIGMGADMVQPMAIVTIGGLIYGTILTLFVVPCMYSIFNKKKKGKRTKITKDNMNDIIESRNMKASGEDNGSVSEIMQ